jgi:Rho termination factor, N-terminal domain
LNSLPPVTKSELESKHFAELHELAADAGIERYRMLSRAELIEQLAVGGGGAPKPKGQRREGGSGSRRPRDRNRGSREPRAERRPDPAPKPAPKPAAPEPAAPKPATSPASERPKRKRRRRRWGRRRKGVRVHDLLLPAAPGRQAIVYAESRAACTALLREVAAELSDASNGPDPIALLIDPTPEELADWKREAPKAEIVSAGKAKHADDALAQARTRANGGEDVIVLIDSLTRFAEAFAGADEARELFDAGLSASGGSLTVVAAVERSA